MGSKASNYTATATDFTIPADETETTDPTEFIIKPLRALDAHTHEPGRGLPIATLPLSVAITGGASVGFPASNDTLVGRGTTDTLTNKELVDPRIIDQVYIGTDLQTLPTAGANAGRWRFTKAFGGSLTVAPASGEALVVPGGTAAAATNATYISPNGESVNWYCNGINWYAL